MTSQNTGLAWSKLRKIKAFAMPLVATLTASPMHLYYIYLYEC